MQEMIKKNILFASINKHIQLHNELNIFNYVIQASVY